jgi:hypothetical protein
LPVLFFLLYFSSQLSFRVFCFCPCSLIFSLLSYSSSFIPCRRESKRAVAEVWAIGGVDGESEHGLQFSAARRREARWM